MSRTAIAILFFVAFTGLLVAFAFFPPEGIQSKADSSDRLVAILALCTSIVSLVGGVVGVAKTALEIKKLRSGEKQRQ